MNKERGLLNLCAVAFKAKNICPLLLTEISELLAQPEQEQSNKWWYGKGVEDTKYFLKREPLGDKQIEYYLERLGSNFKWDDGFKAGVEWAEKAHGIGGEE